jgi:ABC-2 type transport system ATP-binding protein
MFTAMTDLAIEATDLHRTFRVRRGWLKPRRDEIPAVRGVSFAVARGELFGLLGPNGAGKTTTIKMLNTLLTPTAGSARVCGLDVTRQTAEVRRRIGYISGGDRGFYERLSGLDNLRYFAELYAVPPREQGKRIGELLELVGLTGREKERLQGYSRGMRQRLHIARGLLHRPEVLFLDEPSIGLDPVAARELRRTIADLAATGTTVLLTTHYMAEAEELCGRIAVIAAGTIQALGTAPELKVLANGRRVLDVEATGVGERELADVRSLAGVHSVAVEERGPGVALIVQSDAEHDVQSAVLAALAHTRIGRVEARAPSLEDAYVSIVDGVPRPAVLS